MESFDHIIIGGGILGLSAACHLARESSDSVLVLERNELASAAGINADITFIVWNNSGYGEIKRFMNEQDIPAIGVDIYTPSYTNLAREYGFQSWLVESMSDFSEKLALAIEHRGPSLIEIKESGVVSNFPF